MIHTDNLAKKFGAILAVESLSLDVAEGEVFGFLGPNGAGKTTTVRMLTSLIGPTGGSATVAGFTVGQQDTEIRRTVGVLTETPGMYDNLSAEYNLRIFAELYEVKDVKGQIEKYLKMLGLYERRLDAAGTFSKGMKQKLAIARALLHEPRILFLDEPTAGLDPEASHLVREFITELKKEGRTIFLCTHNLDEADRLCDRIGVFKSRLLVVDTPANLRASVFGRKVVFHLRLADENIAGAVRQLAFAREVKVVENKLVVTLDNPDAQNPEVVRVLGTAPFVGRCLSATGQGCLMCRCEQTRREDEEIPAQGRRLLTCTCRRSKCRPFRARKGTEEMFYE
ncbi:MAG: ABC transporter ATP-binding protein [Chloroflexi bacterium]|nr:ABC transporter ATP-binding protein [Chloroflexota bacterium]